MSQIEENTGEPASAMPELRCKWSMAGGWLVLGEGVHLTFTPEQGALARAVAAAPALLAALKGVVRVADRKTVEFDKARAAILSAEGR